MQPLQRRRHCPPVDQQSCKEQIEQHHKGPHEARHADRLERNRKQEHNRRGCEVEKHERQHELPEAHDVCIEPNETVDDSAIHKRGNEAKGKDVEEDLGGEVCEGRVVTVGPVVM